MKKTTTATQYKATFWRDTAHAATNHSDTELVDVFYTNRFKISN